MQALFRAARAAVKLGRHQQALDLVAKGREVDPGAKEFNDIEKVSELPRLGQACKTLTRAHNFTSIASLP
jgi:hypothetical protein